MGDFLNGPVVGVCLPVQWTWIASLVWEDSTCCGAAGPVHHDYRSPWALEPVLHNKRNHLEKKPSSHKTEEPLVAATRESPHKA